MSSPPRPGRTFSDESQASTVPSPPPPPDPTSDRFLVTRHLGDLFDLLPIDAMELLSANIEALVSATGDIPPTPPLKIPHVPHMRGMQAEKEQIVRSHSEKKLARLREQAGKEAKAPALTSEPDPISTGATTTALTVESQVWPQISRRQNPDIDGVRFRDGSPWTFSSSTKPLEPYILIGADSQPLNLQHGAITRKFYSKNEPPVSVSNYLRRMHQYCPMSTAVYLATSLYIHRLAVVERVILVTPRNAHRLLLAGLRVAMKALEDLSYPHRKMARVGGVSEGELARLEISFCFLVGFQLVVGEVALRDHWDGLRAAVASPPNVDVATIDLSVLHLDCSQPGHAPGLAAGT